MSANARNLPPLAAIVSFIDSVNHGDVDRMMALITDDHVLTIFDEAPVSGREALQRAWRGYFDAFPRYVIYPLRLAQTGNLAAVLGYTTGSHLGLPDEEEMRLLLIWTAEVEGGLLKSFTLLEDSPETRFGLGLGD